MAEANWHELTPARKQLLVALVLAVLAFAALFAREREVAQDLLDAAQPPANGPGR